MKSTGLILTAVLVVAAAFFVTLVATARPAPDAGRPYPARMPAIQLLPAYAIPVQSPSRQKLNWGPIAPSSHAVPHSTRP